MMKTLQALHTHTRPVVNSSPSISFAFNSFLFLEFSFALSYCSQSFGHWSNSFFRAHLKKQRQQVRSHLLSTKDKYEQSPGCANHAGTLEILSIVTEKVTFQCVRHSDLLAREE